MKRCDCHSCRARDDRRFWRIVRPLTASGNPLGLPPIPRWEGEPAEAPTIRKGN